MKIFKLFIILFSSSCYSASWGGCKLNSYFYDGTIENVEVFFYEANKLSVDFEKGNTYWGVSLHKLNKGGPNELLKNNRLPSDGVSLEGLVHQNYVRLLKQDLFQIIKKTEKFRIATVPVTHGYSMNAMFNSKVNERSDMMNFSIAIQEYEKYILLTKIVVSSDGELPSVSDVREVVLQFRNSCSIYDAKI